MADLKLFDYAILNGRVVKLVGEDHRYGGCWSTQKVTPGSDEGYYPNRTQKYQVRPIEVGTNVCDKLKFECYCGLVHLRPREVELINRWNPDLLESIQRQEGDQS